MIIETRHEGSADKPFVRTLITESVSAELGAAAWPEPMRNHLIGIQYTARRAGIATRFPHAESLVVLVDGEPAGWLVTADLQEELRIVEILIAPPHRGKRIGSELIESLIRVATAAGKPVRLGVRSGNADAIRLYERLGFRIVGGDAVQFEMERGLAGGSAG